MNQDRRDVFTKISMLGASALAFMGVSRPAKAFEGTEKQNPLLGLWDMVIPVQPAVGAPVPLYFKFAISEAGFVVTGNEDVDAAFNGGFTFSPGMGTCPQTGHNSYLYSQSNWVMDASGNPAGTVNTTGTITVAGDGKTFSGKATTIQYDLNGAVVFTFPNFVFSGTRFSA